MYNVAIIKRTLAGCATIILASILHSCGSNGNDALATFNRAKTLYENGEYEHSLAMLDTLRIKYPEEIELRKKGLHLLTLNQEGLIKNEIASNDSLISSLENEINKLSDYFKYIKHPDMVEGYYIHKSIADETEKTERIAIEPRIDEYDMFYIVSYLTGKDVKHSKIQLSDRAGNSVSTANVPYDGAQNYRYSSGGTTYEIVTFTNAQCDTLGHFVTSNIGSPLKVTFQGKKNYSIQINNKHAKAIAETYRYATNKNKGKAAIKKRMLLESKLQLAKKQIEQTLHSVRSEE